MCRFLSALIPSFAVLLLSGCVSQAPARENVRSSRGAVGACNPANSGHDCIHLNGDGVHASIADAAGIRLADGGTWLLLGFTSEGDGVTANGWIAGKGPSDAALTGARLGGRDVHVRAVRAQGSKLAVELDQGRLVEDPDLGEMEITLAIPHRAQRVSLRLGAASALQGRFGDVMGRALATRIEGAQAASFEGYCRGPSGEARAAVLMEGTQWNPVTGARSSGVAKVGVGCEGGAVVACAAWGYRPWASQEGVSLADHHQACVHMKRAAYCGDERSFTKQGQGITILDELATPIQEGDTRRVEAMWGPNGATCVNEPRAQGFEGCGAPLPRCDEGSPSRDAVLISGLPE